MFLYPTAGGVCRRRIPYPPEQHRYSTLRRLQPPFQGSSRAVLAGHWNLDYCMTMTRNPHVPHGGNLQRALTQESKGITVPILLPLRHMVEARGDKAQLCKLCAAGPYIQGRRRQNHVASARSRSGGWDGTAGLDWKPCVGSIHLDQILDRI